MIITIDKLYRLHYNDQNLLVKVEYPKMKISKSYRDFLRGKLISDVTHEYVGNHIVESYEVE